MVDYKNLRKNSYPPIEEQLDLIYWDKKNNSTYWIDIIDSVKDAYPKPEELLNQDKAN